MPLLVAAAELFGAAVIDLGGRFNFPTDHPLNLSQRARTTIADADFVLALEPIDLWGSLNSFNDQLVRSTRPIGREGQKVAVIGTGEFLTRSNYQEFQRYVGVDMSISGEAEGSLEQLIAIVRQRQTDATRQAATERATAHAEKHRAARQRDHQLAKTGWDASPITTARLVSEIWDAVKDEDWVLCGATESVSSWPQRLWPMNRPYQHVRSIGAAGVGTGIGLAMGIALAHRDARRLVVNIQSDGDLLYAPGALWTAAHHSLPLLNVVHNNRAYHQEAMHIQRMANRHERGVDRAHIGTAIDHPAVDFAGLAKSMGVWAQGPVSEPRELAAALRRAIAIVKAGKPALIDVIAEAR